MPQKYHYEGSELSTKSYEEVKKAYERTKNAIDTTADIINGMAAAIATKTAEDPDYDATSDLDTMATYNEGLTLELEALPGLEEDYYEIRKLAVEAGKAAGCPEATGTGGPDDPSECSIEAWNAEAELNAMAADFYPPETPPEIPAATGAAAGGTAGNFADAATTAATGSGEPAATHTFKEQCFLLSYVKELTAYKKDLDQGNISVAPKNLPYVDDGYNASLLLDGDPFGFVNKMTMHSDQKAFFNLETKDISALQPMIRLFKIIEDTNGEERQQEISFDSHFTSNDLGFFKDKRSRGVGVGIKSFNFSYVATNPFALKKSIKAKLSLFANNFQELLRERIADDGSMYKYIDLALKTGGSETADLANRNNPSLSGEAYDNLTKLNFRLKAIVGWALPSESGGIDGAVRNAIYDSYITLNLTPTIHEFGLDDQGRVNFDINYLAYCEDFFDQPSFDIFSDPEIGARMLKRKMLFKAYNAACDADSIAELKAESKDEIEKDKVKAFQILINNLIDHGRMYTIPVRYDDMYQFLTKTPAYDFANFIPSKDEEVTAESLGASETAEETIKAKEEDASETSSTEIVKTTVDESDLTLGEMVSFFYVSDLIDSILKNIEKNLVAYEEAIDDINLAETDETAATGESAAEEKAEAENPERDVQTSSDLQADEKKRLRKFREQIKSFRILFGPFEVVDPKNPAVTIFVSLGDIPISTRYFIAWLTKKMLKREESRYPMAKFMNDFIQELLRDFMNDDKCFNGQVKQKVFLFSSALTSYRNETESGAEEDNVTQAIKEHGTGARLNISTAPVDLPILNIFGEREMPDGGDQGFDREINYMCYFAGRTQPTEQMTGDRAVDEARGLFHYGIGRDSGIVKSVNFRKTSAPGLKMVRFEQQGYDGLQQLREQYDIDIRTYTNVNALPGTYIFLEPNSFAPSTEVDLTALGIGGYHMIIRSEHTLAAGMAESTITAKWVAEIYDPNRDQPERSDPATAEEESEDQGLNCYSTDRSPGDAVDPVLPVVADTVTGE